MSSSSMADQFRIFLKHKGLKFTYERKIIFEEVQSIKNHFDADELHLILKKKGYRISRDTVYRNIPFLLESGCIQKSVGKGRREYFERVESKGHHDHMICITCGRVIEFYSLKLERVQDAVCKAHEFRLVFHDHRLFGYCKRCQHRT